MQGQLPAVAVACAELLVRAPVPSGRCLRDVRVVQPAAAAVLPVVAAARVRSRLQHRGRSARLLPRHRAAALVRAERDRHIVAFVVACSVAVAIAVFIAIVITVTRTLAVAVVPARLGGSHTAACCRARVCRALVSALVSALVAADRAAHARLHHHSRASAHGHAHGNDAVTRCEERVCGRAFVLAFSLDYFIGGGAARRRYRRRSEEVEKIGARRRREKEREGERE